MQFAKAHWPMKLNDHSRNLSRQILTETVWKMLHFSSIYFRRNSALNASHCISHFILYLNAGHGKIISVRVDGTQNKKIS